MQIENNYSLAPFNTFRLPAIARWFITYDNEEELSRLIRDNSFHNKRFLSIGEGSNLLFVNDFDGVILHSRIKGIELYESENDSVCLRIGAAEHWDDAVAFAVTNGWAGIENLSFIPGTAGAAAVQNIGAYGVEIKDVIKTVEAIHLLTGEKVIFTNEDCRYGYRNSIFKEAAFKPYIITWICLRLQKTPQFKLAYGNLTSAFSGNEITLQKVRDAIIQIRSSKLPDPKELGNVGSFFKNPVIPQLPFDNLKKAYPDIPSFPASEGKYKISAAWLIEQCGFRGKREGNVGVYEKQSLVVVNFGDATGHEIVAFAENIRLSVHKKFGIELTPEVEYIFS